MGVLLSDRSAVALIREKEPGIGIGQEVPHNNVILPTKPVPVIVGSSGLPAGLQKLPSVELKLRRNNKSLWPHRDEHIAVVHHCIEVEFRSLKRSQRQVSRGRVDTVTPAAANSGWSVARSAFVSPPVKTVVLFALLKSEACHTPGGSLRFLQARRSACSSDRRVHPQSSLGAILIPLEYVLWILHAVAFNHVVVNGRLALKFFEQHTDTGDTLVRLLRFLSR